MGLEVVVVVSLIALAGGQLVPENSCPDYFRYVNDAFQGAQGEITLPSLMRGRNRIDIRFSQQGEQDASYVGSLLPYPDENTVRQSKGSAKFRIALRPNSYNGLPKLTRLSYNDRLLCSASEYSPPNSFFGRFWELEISESQASFASSAFNPFTRNGFDPWTTVSNRGPAAVTPAPTRTEILWDKPVQSVLVTLGPPVPTIRNTPAPPPPLPSTVATVPPPTPPPRRFDPRSQLSPVVCGREGTTTPFIVHGNDFARGQYPWLSAVYHKEVRSLAYKCGGSLISASIVISAAHCVHRKTEDRVVVGLGRYDLDDYGEDGAEMRNVLRLLWHPDYNTRTYSDADIALITIERPVTFNDIIAPICMWTVEASSRVSTTGFIAGWGRDEKDSSRTQYPRVVEAEIASPTVCASTWRGTMVTERSLCAGNRDGSGPCVGDSGGGLMVKQGDRWLLRGIVSAGERGPAGTCQLNQYVLFCDLSKHINWINENIR
ncbi:proclotting enzyme isoform X2 [Drosophila erecta]|uniref:proclotting enzyme isoform X2 n=1 Tax=Drosophila erecta TaxID=7220 RepID=UPI000F056C23|nr:proclotting enzyme isoform X2 [Drosophila erecta]